jgi:hypothetical protein
MTHALSRRWLISQEARPWACTKGVSFQANQSFQGGHCFDELSWSLFLHLFVLPCDINAWAGVKVVEP